MGEHNQFFLTANSKNIVIETINLQENIYLAPIMLSRILDIETIMSFNSAYIHGIEQAKIALSKREYIAAAQYISKVRSQSLYNRDEEAFKIWKTLYIYLPCKTLIGAWEDLVFKNIYAIRSVCLSVNNQFILLGSEDGKLIFWEISTAKCLHTFKGHTGSVNSLCLSTDNQFAISGSEDGTLKFWEVATGRCLHIFPKAGNVNSVCLSDDNQFAITGSNDQTLRLWELNTGTCLCTIKGNIIGNVNSVCLSANNLFCVFASDNTLKLWEIATGRLIRTFKGHISTINSVCLSIDNRFALSGSNDKTLKLWEVKTGRCLRTFKGHIGIVSSVCLSADNKFALSGGGDKTLKLWEVATGRCLRTFEGYTGTLSSVYLSNNKQFALSVSSDGALKLWILDWELEDKSLAEWDERARIHLENFLTVHTPYAPALRGNYNPTSVFTRRGIPTWSEDDFQNLLYTLGCAGYGWLHPQVVRDHLGKMTAYWKLIDTEKKIYYVLLYLDLKILPKNINIFINELFYKFFKSKIFKIFKVFISILMRFILMAITVLLWFSYLVSFFRGNT
ncbi:MAG: WD40 repeat domain-containing protein [Nostochopsis sp.]